MIVSHLRLRDYRNISKMEVDLHPKLNVIIGDNGAGKTNILESLIVVSNTKSFRTLSDADLIAKRKDGALIEAKSDNDYRVVITNQGKSLFINRNSIARTSSFIGRLNCVLFKPSDIELFTQSSKERRKIFDIELGKIDPEYLMSLVRYTKLIKDKNHLLKQATIDEIYLATIEDAIIPNIYTLIKKRTAFIDFINQDIQKYYFELSGQNDEIKVEYKRCFEVDQATIKEMIVKNHDKDFMYRYTCLGPHRDDIGFKINNYPVESYASQGQKRMVMIAFKLALIHYIESETKKQPIVLLDDILSELDLDNRNRLINRIKDIGQTIITTTDLVGINFNLDGRVIKIKKGEIYDINECKS